MVLIRLERSIAKNYGINPTYLLRYLRSATVQKYFQDRLTKGTAKTLKIDVLKDLPIPVFNDAIIEECCRFEQQVKLKQLQNQISRRIQLLNYGVYSNTNLSDEGFSIAPGC